MMRVSKIFAVVSVLGFVALASASIHAQNTFYFPQVADARAGALVFRTTLIFVNTGNDATVTVSFFDSSGSPMSIELVGLGNQTVFEFLLPPGGSVSHRTPGTAEGFRVGYAVVETGPGVGGTAVFSRIDGDTGVVLSEAGVPASTTLDRFSFFVDSLGSRDTGLALVNPSQEPATLRMRLYDKSFQLIASGDPIQANLPLATTDVPLGPATHGARFVFEIFSDAAAQAGEMEGIVTVESDRAITAVTLRSNDPASPFPEGVPTLTTFPVVPGAADASGVAASFSRIPAGDIVLAVDLGEADPLPVGIMIELFQGELPVGEFIRGVDRAGLLTDIITPQALTGRPARVDRVEIRPVYAGGRIGPRSIARHE